MDSLGLLQRATDFYDHHLAAVSADQWAQPSICDGWSIKDLADHVLGGNRFALGMLDGLDPSTAFALALEGGFADEPLTSYRQSVAAQRGAFAVAGALDRIVHHPAGGISAQRFLEFRIGDLLLHGWDLAQTTGEDDTLDPELAQITWNTFQDGFTDALARGMFGDGPTSNITEHATLQTRLLDLTGRLPH